jgi:uncharacterized membrane protein YozB (DUF420 family)
MTLLLSALDYSVFPPVNAALNGLSTVLLLTGFFLIKSGKRRAHQAAMIAALVSSALFLACYLVYHYGAGHTEFPKEYPVARKVYFAILIPHILLAVVNLPFIILVVVAAAKGNFDKHKRLARFTFPSWLFVSVTGVVIYFMIYQWFPAREKQAGSHPRIPLPASGTTAAATPAAATPAAAESAPPSSAKDGSLVFTPVSQTVRADPGAATLDVFFKVENTADTPAAITSLESGCECLDVSIDLNPIPAKSVATIKGTFDITKLRGSAERKIVVTPEGRTRPVFLNTRIEIEPVYEIDPPMITWAKGSVPDTRTVAFKVVRKEPVHILSAESKRPEVACKVVEKEKGRLYHLELTPASTEASLLGIVRIETDCEIGSYARALAYFSIQ